MRQFSGKLLREIREKKGDGYSQGKLAFDLAKYLDKPVSQGSVSDWENGSYDPGANKLVALADVLKCKIGDFFCDASSINYRTGKHDRKHKAA